MKRRIFKRAASFCVLALFATAILFSEFFLSHASPGWLRSLAIEVRAACRDPGTQWMVFLCAGIYFVTFTALGKRGARNAESSFAQGYGGQGGKGEPRTSNPEPRTLSGERRSPDALVAENLQPATFNLQPADWWLCGLLLIAALHYAFNYATASGSTQALMLMVGAAIGKGARLWISWGKAESGKAESGKGEATTKLASQARLQMDSQGETVASRQEVTEHTKGSTECLQPSVFNLQRLLTVLLLLLGMAALWHPEGAMQFQYRGLNRWSGPWDNPNIFGLLMGVGVVLACGLWVASGRLKGAGSPVWKRWSWRVLLVLAVSCCAVGLLKSYSRGAWLGTALGLAVLGYQASRFQVLRFQVSSSCGSCVSCVSWFRKNWRALSVVLLSLVVLAFWQFRHTEFHPVRRAFSVGNPNDFSWRNRVAAWEGALAMMADKPVAGFGWNKPERIYDQFYRPAKVSEGMAIQLNHYFILGLSLGLPALICFAAYIGLSLMPRNAVPLLGGVRGGFGGSTIYDGRFTIGRSLRSMFDVECWMFDVSLPLICRSAAVVLLVGLWFDGGLFNLATASVFWVLLEVGRVAPCRGPSKSSPSGLTRPLNTQP
jgi:O-antigen ligase